MSKAKSRAEQIYLTLNDYAASLSIERASIDMEALCSLFHFHIVSKQDLHNKSYRLIMANNNEPYPIGELEMELSKFDINIKFIDNRTNKNTELQANINFINNISNIELTESNTLSNQFYLPFSL